MCIKLKVSAANILAKMFRLRSSDWKSERLVSVRPRVQMGFGAWVYKTENSKPETENPVGGFKLFFACQVQPKGKDTAALAGVTGADSFAIATLSAGDVAFMVLKLRLTDSRTPLTVF